eukprot:6796726-Prymnesium_polylepis.1
MARRRSQRGTVPQPLRRPPRARRQGGEWDAGLVDDRRVAFQPWGGRAGGRRPTWRRAAVQRTAGDSVARAGHHVRGGARRAAAGGRGGGGARKGRASGAAAARCGARGDGRRDARQICAGG